MQVIVLCRSGALHGGRARAQRIVEPPAPANLVGPAASECRHAASGYAESVEAV